MAGGNFAKVGAAIFVGLMVIPVLFVAALGLGTFAAVGALIGFLVGGPPGAGIGAGIGALVGVGIGGIALANFLRSKKEKNLEHPTQQSQPTPNPPPPHAPSYDYNNRPQPSFDSQDNDRRNLHTPTGHSGGARHR